jgi:hypothetical protein
MKFKNGVLSVKHKYRFSYHFFLILSEEKNKGSSSKVAKATTLHSSIMTTLQDILGSKSVVSLVLIHVIHYRVLFITCRDVSKTIFLREREKQACTHAHTTHPRARTHTHARFHNGALLWDVVLVN